MIETSTIIYWGAGALVTSIGLYYSWNYLAQAVWLGLESMSDRSEEWWEGA